MITGGNISLRLDACSHLLCSGIKSTAIAAPVSFDPSTANSVVAVGFVGTVVDVPVVVVELVVVAVVAASAFVFVAFVVIVVVVVM